MSHRVVHFEIPCDNPEETVEFFKNAFGWNFQPFGEGYWLATTGADNEPGINGAVMKRKHPQQPLVNSIDVASIDEMVKKIEQLGGVVVLPKMAIPKVGYLAYFKDPSGNIHGLWQNDSSAA